ncbi:hypothetical protein ACLB1G_05480 [Oxalobacteraceae bacterium A2-2]
MRPDERYNVAELGFWLLFPGFFAYHTLLGLGLMRAVLGGYFAVVAMALLPPLLLRYRRLAPRPGHTDLALLGFLAYFLVLIALHAASGANPTIVNHHLLGIVFLVDLYIIFRTADFGRPRFRLLLLLSLFGMSATVFSFAVDGAFYLGALGAARDPESVATYQGFSRSYLTTLVAVLAWAPSARQRWLLYALGLPTLFVNTARSEFAALLFLLPLVELHCVRHKISLLAGMAALAGAAHAALPSVLRLLPNNRTLELLDLSHSTSAQLRHQLSLQAWRTIEAHPLLGDYASYHSGYYAHNGLSAWVDLGLAGMLYLAALLAVPTARLATSGYLRRSAAPGFLLPWSLLAITILLLCTSHYFTDMLIGAALGAYGRYQTGGHHG